LGRELELISRFEAQLFKRRNATARLHCGAAIGDGRIKALQHGVDGVSLSQTLSRLAVDRESDDDRVQ
jgi:hypothetical protein